MDENENKDVEETAGDVEKENVASDEMTDDFVEETPEAEIPAE